MKTTLYFYDRFYSLIFIQTEPIHIPRKTERVEINDKYYGVDELIYDYKDKFTTNIRCYLK